MRILGIETSCDETAAAVVTDGRVVLSNVIASQIEAHAAYGGVIPELAAREHLMAIAPVVRMALHQSGSSIAEIDAIAVTHAPGLVPALLVGVAYAKGLALATGRPLIGVNHILAHVYGAFLDDPSPLAEAETFPLLALAVSGGHTLLLLVAADGRATVVGRTLDDAAGEAFDKGAKILNLGYPGGPVIDRLARRGNAAAVAFPRGLLARPGHPAADENRFNFSFSGIKTALLYHVRDRRLDDRALADVVASYQEAIVDVLSAKALQAAAYYGAPALVLCGGVASNSRLRTVMQSAAASAGRRLTVSPPRYCTDNAAMIAGIGHRYLEAGFRSGLDLAVSARLPQDLGAVPLAGCRHPVQACHTG